MSVVHCIYLGLFSYCRYRRNKRGDWRGWSPEGRGDKISTEQSASLRPNVRRLVFPTSHKHKINQTHTHSMKMLSTEYRLKNLLGLSPQPTVRWIFVFRVTNPQHNWYNNKVSTSLLSISRTQSTAYDSYTKTSDSTLHHYHSPSSSPTMVATFHTLNPMAELSMSTSSVTSHSRPPILRKAKSYVTHSAEESSGQSPRQSRGIYP